MFSLQQEAHDFYKTWTDPDFPWVLIIEIQHANPYYDDSYAFTSSNLGPYGDTIACGETWNQFNEPSFDLLFDSSTLRQGQKAQKAQH